MKRWQRRKIVYIKKEKSDKMLEKKIPLVFIAITTNFYCFHKQEDVKWYFLFQLVKARLIIF